MSGAALIDRKRKVTQFVVKSNSRGKEGEWENTDKAKDIRIKSFTGKNEGPVGRRAAVGGGWGDVGGGGRAWPGEFSAVCVCRLLGQEGRPPVKKKGLTRSSRAGPASSKQAVQLRRSPGDTTEMLTEQKGMKEKE